MHEKLFSDAAFAEGATVLKLALRPFSIGHEILLFKTSNPLATYTPESFKELGERVQRQKLFSAVFICERTWKQNHAPVQWLRLTTFFRRKCDTANEVEKFQAYRNSGCADFPITQQPRIKGVPYHYFGAPGAARLLMFSHRNELHRLCGVETPFDVPMALAQMLYSAQLESDGAIWVKNYSDFKLAEDIKQREEAFDKLHPSGAFAQGDDEVQAAAERWNAEHPESPVPLLRPKEEN